MRAGGIPGRKSFRSEILFIRVPPIFTPAASALGAVGAELYPRGLDIDDERMERQPRDRVHQQGLPPGRAAPRLPFQIKRRLEMNERQRHELGKASG